MSRTNGFKLALEPLEPTGRGKPILSLRFRMLAGRMSEKTLRGSRLKLAVLELHVRRNRGRELDQRVVQEGSPRLDAVGHAHAVFDLQQRGQER